MVEIGIKGRQETIVTTVNVATTIAELGIDYLAIGALAGAFSLIAALTYRKTSG